MVPPDEALGVVEECGRAGVKALLVLSSGFAEAGDEGVKLQNKLRRRARRSGMRVVGPNSFGLINNDRAIRLNASLAEVIPDAGRLGLFAQSGALGIAVLASAARRGLGISVFASAGNRVDVSGNDLMQYWIDDQETDTVGLYLESMGNPRKFSRIARQLALVKPVIVVSSGVSSFAAPAGHRTRTTKVPPGAFRALLRQAGVIRVENIHQLFDVAQLTLHQPLPRGDRVAIVGNSDALGSISASACVSWGLEVAHGPVSLLPQASAQEFASALEAAFADPDVDSVVASFIPALATTEEHVSAALTAVAARFEKPCVATFLGVRGVDKCLDYLQGDGVARSVPAYALPEDGIRALNAVTKYAQWRARDRGTTVAPVGVDRARAEALIDGFLGDNPDGRVLTRDETEQLLAAYGMRLWPAVEVTDAVSAVAAADALTYPVILKSTSPVVRHQPGIVGVRSDLIDAESVRDAHTSLSERLGPLGADRFVVQRMAVPGVSCVLRASEDSLFGPGGQLLGGRAAHRPARRHRAPHPAAHRRRRQRSHRRRQGRTAARRSPRGCPRASGCPLRLGRPAVGAGRRPRRAVVGRAQPGERLDRRRRRARRRDHRAAGAATPRRRPSGHDLRVVHRVTPSRCPPTDHWRSSAEGRGTR